MRLVTFSVLMLLSLQNCSNQPQTASNTPGQPEQTTQSAGTTEPPADFNMFYQKFHTDSLYQIEHISWPLSGETTVPVDSTQSRKKSVQWTPATWRMHRPINLSTGEFQREFQMLGDVVVMERIRYTNANYGLERRFARRDDGSWEMIYYADMQELK